MDVWSASSAARLSVMSRTTTTTCSFKSGKMRASNCFFPEGTSRAYSIVPRDPVSRTLRIAFPKGAATSFGRTSRIFRPRNESGGT